MLPSLKSAELPPTKDFLCDFCSSLSDKRLQIAMLLRRLTKEANYHRGAITGLDEDEERKGFQQLTRVMFGYEGSLKYCSHDKYYNLLINRLKISSKLLTHLCGKVAAQLAQRNCQLATLSQQITNETCSIQSSLDERSSDKQKKQQGHSKQNLIAEAKLEEKNLNISSSSRMSKSYSENTGLSLNATVSHIDPSLPKKYLTTSLLRHLP